MKLPYRWGHARLGVFTSTAAVGLSEMPHAARYAATSRWRRQSRAAMDKKKKKKKRQRARSARCRRRTHALPHSRHYYVARARVGGRRAAASASRKQKKNTKRRKLDAQRCASSSIGATPINARAAEHDAYCRKVLSGKWNGRLRMCLSRDWAAVPTQGSGRESIPAARLGTRRNSCSARTTRSEIGQDRISACEPISRSSVAR